MGPQNRFWNQPNLSTPGPVFVWHPSQALPSTTKHQCWRCQDWLVFVGQQQHSPVQFGIFANHGQSQPIELQRDPINANQRQQLPFTKVHLRNPGWLLSVCLEIRPKKIMVVATSAHTVNMIEHISASASVSPYSVYVFVT